MNTYQITDEDVDGVVRYMEIHHPEKADRDYCRTLLEYVKSSLHQIARNNPDDIEALYEKYEASLKEKTDNT